MYIGKLLDTTTNLYYYGARFYDSSIGRFITADTNMGSTSDPQSLNRYIYARDNPMSLVDPTGHMFTYSGGGESGGNTVQPQPPPVQTVTTTVTTSTVQTFTATTTTYITGSNGVVTMTTTTTTTTVVTVSSTTTTKSVQGGAVISSSSTTLGSRQVYQSTTTNVQLSRPGEPVIGAGSTLPYDALSSQYNGADEQYNPECLIQGGDSYDRAISLADVVMAEEIDPFAFLWYGFWLSVSVAGVSNNCVG